MPVGFNGFQRECFRLELGLGINDHPIVSTAHRTAYALDALAPDGNHAGIEALPGLHVYKINHHPLRPAEGEQFVSDVTANIEDHPRRIRRFVHAHTIERHAPRDVRDADRRPKHGFGGPNPAQCEPRAPRAGHRLVPPAPAPPAG